MLDVIAAALFNEVVWKGGGWAVDADDKSRSTTPAARVQVKTPEPVAVAPRMALQLGSLRIEIA